MTILNRIIQIYLKFLKCNFTYLITKLKKKDLKFRLNFTFTTSNSQIFFVY